MLMIATHALPAILIWRTDMSKATVESVMKYVWAMRAAATEQILAPCGANIGELEIADAALRAEVERLAAQAEPAPAPSREVRLLTSKDIDDVRKTLWRDAQMNLSDLHAEDAAKAFQCKFCEVNGLTVKEQS